MDGRALEFKYTNWRGETSMRLAQPVSVRWGNNEWHAKPQWLLRAYDLEKGADREFALSCCDFSKGTTK